MNRIRFTKAALDALSVDSSASRVVYYDDKARGLCIMVAPRTKTFYVLRKHQGKTERILIGRYPDTTIEQARNRAGQINSELDAGRNRNDVKRQRRAELTLGELHTIYMERHAKTRNRKPENAENNYRRYLSEWANRKLSEIKRSEVQVLIAKLAKDISPATANITLALLRAMFNRAIDWELYKGANPTANIPTYPELSRDRFLYGDELERFLAALPKVESATMRDFFTMLLATGARKSNVAAMRWADINLSAAVWRVPDTKNGEPYQVALTGPALQILKRRREVERGEWVFSATSKSGHIQEPKKAWSSLLKDAQIENLRMHDLRRTFGSFMAAQGASLQMIGKALGHKSQDATLIYARLNLDPVRQAVDAAAAAMFPNATEFVTE
ncbi:tyrosine-type recombinase/integrase [Nitrosovibrio tenuis]|uniref:Site-specific recombinase XerD n=1 Tax=Nitrosovibrio tenuis TaxID=1233 RepID=A0A1H7R9U9_9PROT|nr:tyrosine-type recombinase/integrase [Nitrosovibrio tenuis]SEL56929.1 Site-specific recombinase XerD [Nitrosovibrio tenuis]